MKALVTGGAGFVGRRLVAALQRRGVATRILDINENVAADDVVIGSVTDGAVAARAVAGVDTVYHLAGVADLWRPDADIFEAVNVEGTRTIVEAARAAGVARFVQCSSLTTLVSRHAPLGESQADETLEIDPDDLIGDYPRSKREADLLVLAAAEDGFNASIAMPTEPLGAGDESETPPTRMILDFLNGKTPAYIDCILNFVPVGALAEGLIAVADGGARGERYLLGGENVPMTRLLAMLTILTGRSMPTLKLPYAVAYAAGVVDTGVMARITGRPPKAPLTGVRLAGRRVSFTSEKAARDLGWHGGAAKPALAEMIAWARETGRIRGDAGTA